MIRAGVLCEVIGGVDGLNVGKIVEVCSLQGEHSEYGRIWRCKSKGADLITYMGAVGAWADFAQSWLRPLPNQNECNIQQLQLEMK